MPYVDRDQQGRIVGVFAVQQYDGQEFVEGSASIETPPTVPQIVTRFQARAALHLAGLLPQVEGLMAHPDTPVLAKLAWADAQDFKRNSPTIAQMAAALGLTSEQLDALFTTAAGIDA